MAIGTNLLAWPIGVGQPLSRATLSVRLANTQASVVAALTHGSGLASFEHDHRPFGIDGCPVAPTGGARRVTPATFGRTDQAFLPAEMTAGLATTVKLA